MVLKYLLEKIESRLTFRPYKKKWKESDESNYQEFSVLDKYENNIHLRFYDLKTKDVLIFSHGNESNISQLDHKCDFFRKIGLSFITYDYPGYGKSSGVPSEQKLFSSHEAVIKFVNSELGFDLEKNIIIFGQSLGGAVTCDFASKQKVKAVILESTFTSTHDMSKVVLKGLPVYLFISNKFVNIEKVGKINSPLLFAHGTLDNLTPFSFAKRLLAKSRKETSFLFEIEGGDHWNQIEKGGENYVNAVREFLSKIE